MEKTLTLLLIGQGVVCNSVAHTLNKLGLNYYWYKQPGQGLWFKTLSHPINTPKTIQQINTWVAQQKINAVLLCGCGELLQTDTLNALQCPVFNLHPSLLPHYRGPNPYSAVILNHEPQTGLTLHLVDAGIDTGPIVCQSPAIMLSPTETYNSLRHRLAQQVPTLIAQWLDLVRCYGVSALPTIAQPKTGSYYPHPLPEYYWVNWHDAPKQVETQSRAFQGRYPQLTLANGVTVQINSITLVPNHTQWAGIAGQVLKHHWWQKTVWVASSHPQWIYRVEGLKALNYWGPLKHLMGYLPIARHTLLLNPYAYVTDNAVPLC